MHEWRIIFTDGSDRNVRADYMSQEGKLFGPPGDYVFCVGGSSVYTGAGGTEVLRIIRDNVQSIEPIGCKVST